MGRQPGSGETGAVARAARAVAALSVKVPVVIVLDDADLLDPGLARAVIGGLAGRYDGRVLVVAAARPGSDLVAGLVKEAGPDLAGRVRRADADPGMAYPDRVELGARAAAGPARARPLSGSRGGRPRSGRSSRSRPLTRLPGSAPLPGRRRRPRRPMR